MCVGFSTVKEMNTLPEREKFFIYSLIFACGFMSKGINEGCCETDIICARGRAIYSILMDMDALPVSEKRKFEEVLPIEHLERQDVSFRAWIIDLFLNLIIEEIFHPDRHKSKIDLQFKVKSAIHCFMDKGQKGFE